MNVKQIIPYQLRKTIPALALVGTALLPIACKEKETEIEPIHDVELKFSRWDFDHVRTDTIAKYAKNSSVRTIYLTPYANNGFSSYNAADIHKLRTTLERSIMVDPSKVRGRGELEFMPGISAKNPADSLWFVYKGWSVNPQKQR